MKYDSRASVVFYTLNKFTLHIFGENVEFSLMYTLGKCLNFCINWHNFHCVECKITSLTFLGDKHKKPNSWGLFFLKTDRICRWSIWVMLLDRWYMFKMMINDFIILYLKKSYGPFFAHLQRIMWLCDSLYFENIYNSL